jgi:hypothetical protein
MALWEYKVITSGPHGFASPSLLEAHLNALGKDEWEIIHFQTLPNNSLAFHGLARRSTTRDWTPPPEVALAPPQARPSAYEPAPGTVKSSAPAVEKPELPAAVAEEMDAGKSKASDASLRPMRNTERDLDPDADEEEDDWDSWNEQQEDELPTFFEAIKPHLRRNQKGPGMSVAVDYLAKRWEQKESDLVGALKECGFTIPDTEEADPDYFEFEGDLYWVNRNNRGQLFINTREKPRPVFRTAPATKLQAGDPATSELVAERAAEKAEIEKRKNERAERQAAAAAQAQARAEAAAARAAAQQAAREQAGAARADNGAGANAGTDDAAGETPADTPAGNEPAGPLPDGEALLERIKPMMRRNRRGPGYSGSVSFLARALKHSEADLVAAFGALGLNAPANPNDKPVYVEIGDGLYWVNKDGRGGIWINGREKPRTHAGQGAPATAGGEQNARTSEGGAEKILAADVTKGETAPLPLGDAAAANGKADAPTSTSTGRSSENPDASSSADTGSAAAPATSNEATGADQAPAPSGVGDSALAGVRLLLKPNKRGSGVSGEIGFLARTLEKSDDAFLATLTGAGLIVPADSEDKPVFVEQAGEIFWINKNSTDGSLWLNAKAARSAARKSGGSRPRSPRKSKADSGAEDKAGAPAEEGGDA